MVKFIYFITGASGTGKTSLVTEIKKKYKDKNWIFLHFDSIGIPPQEEMVEQSGSIEKWQKEITFLWIKKMLIQYIDNNIIVFEGQVNLEFIKEGFKKYKFSKYEIVLIDCSDKVMAKRLTEMRKQPELVTKDMYNWLHFLRKQAKKLNAQIIETSNKNKTEVLNSFESILEKLHI